MASSSSISSILLPSKNFTPSISHTPRLPSFLLPLNFRLTTAQVLNSSDASNTLQQRSKAALQSFNGTLQLLWCPQDNVKKRGYCEKERQSVTEHYPIRPLIILKPIILSLSIFSLSSVLCGYAQASEATIKASNLGLKIASILRRTGWPDEAIVFLMAMLPVLELRGAIPVGYWMQLDPLKLSLISILGNMAPVPFIVLYMEKLATFLSTKSPAAKKNLDVIFESTRRKAGPIQEFKWLGLMLFVAVPFPGTGAWSGAMIASLLGMHFWDAISANFLGVVMAGVLVNLLVNLGFKFALLVGVGLFLISTFMWSFLRAIVQKNPR